MILPDPERAALYSRAYYQQDGSDTVAWQERRLRPDLVASLCYAFGATERLTGPGDAGFERQLQWIKTELAAPRRPRFALSVGCGRGEYEAALAELGVPFAAIDFSQSAVDLTRKTIREWTGRKCDGTIHSCSVVDLLRLGEIHLSPDTLVFNETLEHLPKHQFLAVVGYYKFVHPLLIIINQIGFHPILTSNRPELETIVPVLADSEWNHVTQVDDEYFDEIERKGRVVFRVDSHLVVQL